jgi:hypothetical protein
MSLSWRLIQPIKDRVHLAYEYRGQSDPTRETNRKVCRDEMVARVTKQYVSRIRNNRCPKAHSLTRPADPVSPETVSSFDVFSFLMLRTRGSEYWWIVAPWHGE